MVFSGREADCEMTAEQPVIPMLSYRDGIATMDWLIHAFGFAEHVRRVNHGLLSHGELLANGALIMLATPSPEYEGPKQHREHCEPARKWNAVPYVVDGVLVYVDDVEAHWMRARGAGATILSEPEDTPFGRLYRAEDLEGHRWMFVSRKKQQ